MSEILLLIPARFASTRLPGKPLADIGGKPMILHVVDRAREALLGEPVVCTDDERVLDVVTRYGATAIMTSADHVSGSDRIWEATQKFDPDAKAKFILNVQGDLPTISPELLQKCVEPLRSGDADIATLATAITEEEEKTDPNVVKVIACQPVKNNASKTDNMRALYFTRATAPWGEGPLYHHIGLYAYRRDSLQRFVQLPPSPLELREKLEQLRALENGMKIDVSIVDTAPLGVDTPQDLEIARKILATQATGLSR